MRPGDLAPGCVASERDRSTELPRARVAKSGPRVRGRVNALSVWLATFTAQGARIVFVGFIERVDEALEIVIPDPATLVSPPSDFSVVQIERSVYIEQNGDINGGDVLVDRHGPVQLLVDVADAVQSHISFGAGDEVWPVCPSHGFGLHPEVRGVGRSHRSVPVPRAR